MSRSLKEIEKEISILVEEANIIYRAYQKLDVDDLQKKYQEISEAMANNANLEPLTIDKYKQKLKNLKERISEKEDIENDYEEITISLERHLLGADIRYYNVTRMQTEVLKFDLSDTLRGANKTVKRLQEIFNETDLEKIMDLINHLCKLNSANKVSIKDGKLIKGDDLEFGDRLESILANKRNLKEVLSETSKSKFYPSDLLKHYATYCANIK